MRRAMVYAAAVGLSATLALSGCGDDNGSSDGGGGGAYGGGNGTTATTEAPATTAQAPVTRPETIGTASGSLGTFLVDRQGRTLYLWEADTGGTSTCSGSCAAAWPPLLTKGKPTATGGAKSNLLGTTTRSGGATQVTYDGHPLYRYLGDTADGDTNGQGSNGFGALWWVVAPSGTAITKR